MVLERSTRSAISAGRKAPPARGWEIDEHLRSQNKSDTCLHIGDTVGSICGKPAIGSHTVPRKMLKQIARNGHVYQHSATLQDLLKTQGRLSIKLIGVNDASVLRVFRERHDSETFAPLEQASFVGSRGQCFLLAYRALCHDVFKKSSALNSLDVLKDLDRGRPLPEQVEIQKHLAASAEGSRLSLRDMNEHKQRFDSMLAARDYSETKAFIVMFDKVPDILCSGAIYPEANFAGQPLQNMGDFSKKLELITFSLIASGTGGAFAFAWHLGCDSVCRRLAASLDRLSDDELPHAIVRFIFEFCENHYFNPDWWDKADQNLKAFLTTRLQTSATPWKVRSAACLVDDGLRLVSWKVTSRIWL